MATDLHPATGPDPDGAVEVRYLPDRKRFVALLDGAETGAYLDVMPSATVWTIAHTEVPPELEGRGIGSSLVRAALAHVRGQGAQVLPLCPFTVGFLRSHPDEADVVHPNFRYMIR